MNCLICSNFLIFSLSSQLNSISNVEEETKSDNQVVNKFQELAKRLWENEVDLYQAGRYNSKYFLGSCMLSSKCCFTPDSEL